MKKMKLVCLIAFLLIGFHSHCQSGIELPEFNVLYAGYPNAVRPISTKKGKLKLVGTNCTITKNEDYYSVVPEKGKRSAQLTLIVEKGNKTDTVFSKMYKVRRLPDPTVFFGAVSAGGNVDEEETKLFAKYDDDILLNATFSIIEWTFIVGQDSVRGFGNKLENVSSLLENQNRSSTVKIITVVEGPDQVRRELTNEWQIPLKNRVGYNNFEFKCFHLNDSNVYKNESSKMSESIQLNSDSTYTYTISFPSAYWSLHTDMGTYTRNKNQIILNSSSPETFYAALNHELKAVSKEELNGYYEEDIFCNGTDEYLVFIRTDNENLGKRK